MGFYGSQLNYQMNAQTQNNMTATGSSANGISLFQLQGMSMASQSGSNFFNATSFSSFGQGNAGNPQGPQALLMQLLNLAWSQSNGSSQQQAPFRAPKQCSPSELKILLIELLQEDQGNCRPRCAQPPAYRPPIQQCLPTPMQQTPCEPKPCPPKMERPICNTPAPSCPPPPMYVEPPKVDPCPPKPCSPKVEPPPVVCPPKMEPPKKEKLKEKPMMTPEVPEQSGAIDSRLSERFNPDKMKRFADKLQWMKESGNYKGSPLTLDLDGDGKLTGPGKQAFDLNGDGKLEKISNVDKGDGMLAIDTNGNGKVDNGKELFGNYTEVDGKTYANGFDALKAFAEKNLAGSTSDGKLDEKELKALEEKGLRMAKDGDLKKVTDFVSEIDLNYTEDKTKEDKFGNGLYQSASFKTKNGETRNVTDVWFNMEEVA